MKNTIQQRKQANPNDLEAEFKDKQKSLKKMTDIEEYHEKVKLSFSKGETTNQEVDNKQRLLIEGEESEVQKLPGRRRIIMPDEKVKGATLNRDYKPELKIDEEEKKSGIIGSKAQMGMKNYEEKKETKKEKGFIEKRIFDEEHDLDDSFRVDELDASLNEIEDSIDDLQPMKERNKDERRRAKMTEEKIREDKDATLDKIQKPVDNTLPEEGWNPLNQFPNLRTALQKPAFDEFVSTLRQKLVEFLEQCDTDHNKYSSRVLKNIYYKLFCEILEWIEASHVKLESFTTRIRHGCDFEPLSSLKKEPGLSEVEQKSLARTLLIGLRNQPKDMNPVYIVKIMTKESKTDSSYDTNAIKMYCEAIINKVKNNISKFYGAIISQEVITFVTYDASEKTPEFKQSKVFSAATLHDITKVKEPSTEITEIFQNLVGTLIVAINQGLKKLEANLEK